MKKLLLLMILFPTCITEVDVRKDSRVCDHLYGGGFYCWTK